MVLAGFDYGLVFNKAVSRGFKTNGLTHHDNKYLTPMMTSCITLRGRGTNFFHEFMTRPEVISIRRRQGYSHSNAVNEAVAGDFRYIVREPANQWLIYPRINADSLNRIKHPDNEKRQVNELNW